MPTVMNRPQISHPFVHRTIPQRVCITLGFAFIVLGLVGIIMPAFLGMHLSMSHNFIHLLSGALALLCGYSEKTTKAYLFCLGFGVVYGLLGIAGFVIGEPGYPGVGHMEADQYLFRVLPNVLEFGTLDHIVHILISAIFLVTAMSWKKDLKRSDFERKI